MKRPIAERERIIAAYHANEIDRTKAAELLGCTTRTIDTYSKKFLVYGKRGLWDHRHSNYHKLTDLQKQQIIDLKKKDRWRSARNIRDHFQLKVHKKTVSQIIVQAGLNRENLIRIKPIQRFEADGPNAMWQTDIMGRIDFPKAGRGYLIATLDDYSRFVPAGRWFRNQGKMNVFQIWYESLTRYGLPKKMLQDEGSQYKARARLGLADYQWYASQLGIKLLWARKAQVKGKIERYWKFVQSDFVSSVWEARSLEEINGRYKVWLAQYNYRFRSEYFDNETRAARYRPSERKVKRVELETILQIEERRKVTRESTISLYGRHYYVPPGYIGCHIWVKIRGRQILFEANGEVFYRSKLRVS